tara:strand:+ start:365 stop:1261 length:897 start_codon:yes stop_codon:yes gene_type:complete
MRTTISYLGAALLSLVSLSSADVWTEALGKELGAATKTKVVLEAYRAVVEAKHARAADARWRRAELFASLNQKDETKAELEALAKEFPKSYAAAVKKALGDLPSFVGHYDRKRAEKTLKSRPVSLNFPNTPLGEVISFLQDITGLNVVLLPSADPALPVSLRLKDVKLESALKLILATDGDLEYQIVRNMILIGKDMSVTKDKKWSQKEIEANPGLAWKVLSQRLTLNFDQTPFGEVCGFLRDISGVNLVLSKTVEGANPDISLRLKEVRLRDVLTLITGSNGFRWSADSGAIRIDAQ